MRDLSFKKRFRMKGFWLGAEGLERASEGSRRDGERRANSKFRHRRCPLCSVVTMDPYEGLALRLTQSARPFAIHTSGDTFLSMALAQLRSAQSSGIWKPRE